MTRIYFFRHAESEMNTHADVIGGRSNHTPLSEKGVRQAKALGQWLPNSSIRPDVIYVSPAVRTIQTADHSLSEANWKRPHFRDPRIQELAQGVMEGVPRAIAYDEPTRAQIAKEEFDFKFEDGESIAEVMQRMMDFVTDIVAAHPGKTVLVYGHGFSIRALAGAIDALPHDDVVFGLTTPNVSLTLIESGDDGLKVHYVGKRVIDEDSV
jgi:broad specificity phosphatase PhoE